LVQAAATGFPAGGACALLTLPIALLVLVVPVVFMICPAGLFGRPSAQRA